MTFRKPVPAHCLAPSWRVLLASVIALVLGGPTPVGAQVPRDDPRFGAVQAINAPERAMQAGVRWERVMFPWAEMQPNSPDEMRPSYYTDRQLQDQARRGVTLVGVIVYTPGWAAVDPAKGWGAVPKGLDRPHTDRQNTLANFVGKLAEKYKGTVDSWIVWNEPDLISNEETKESSNWAGSVEEFWLLQKSAYLAIKRANGNAKVLLPGFSYWHYKQAGLPPYLQRLLEVAANDRSSAQNNWFFDAVAVHPYGNPLNSYALPTLYRRILAERGLQQKPIWNVEANAVPWDDPIGLIPREPWRVTMEEQASFVIQSLALGLAGNAERLSIYKMRDEFPEEGQFFGLVREDGSVRPAYTALQTAVTHFTGAKQATYTWNGSANPPSAAEVEAVITSNRDRYQFVWPGQVAQVAIERDNHRVTAIWNVSRRPLVGLVSAAANEATLVDAQGRKAPITAQDGAYRVYLDSARSNTEPRDRELLLVGGRPWLIIEQIGANRRPSQPPRVADGLSFESGFSVANAQFAEYFQGRGGKDTFGLPISREFDLLGSPTQIFQRHVMQLDEERNVRTLNLIDPEMMPYTRMNGMQAPGPDPAFAAGAPNPSDPAYAQRIVEFIRQQSPDTWQGQPVGFGEKFLGTVTCAAAFPVGECQQGLLPLLNLEVWGVPTSPPTADPANGDFIYQRFQRGIMHYDARCRCTQGVLLGELFKSIVTGQGLPADLEEQARESPYLKQYDQSRAHGMSRPGALARSNFKDAFEPLP